MKQSPMQTIQEGVAAILGVSVANASDLSYAARLAYIRKAARVFHVRHGIERA
jgi:hypothetical protein